MSIRKIADNMFKVKRIGDVYATKKEYRDYHKNEILEKWDNKLESYEERKSRLEKIDFWRVNEYLETIDKKFCKDIEKFVNIYDKYINRNLIGVPDISHFLDNRLKYKRDSKKIIIDFIIDRCNTLIELDALYIPFCENENDVNRWFKDNCYNLGLIIPLLHKRHANFEIKYSGKYGGIDYICKFIDMERYRLGNSNPDNCEYIPNLFKYIGHKDYYHKFLDFSEADNLLVELEYLSSNFVRHGHPDIVDMIICYKKDRDLDIPILYLSK